MENQVGYAVAYLCERCGFFGFYKPESPDRGRFCPACTAGRNTFKKLGEIVQFKIISEEAWKERYKT